MSLASPMFSCACLGVALAISVALQGCGSGGREAPTSNPTTPSRVGWCSTCPALQTFEENDESAPQCRQQCPDQHRFQWIKDLIKKGCNQIWQLEAKTYYIDRQYLLPCGVQVRGAGAGLGGTVIKAVRCEEPGSDYGLGTEGVKYRIGFVVNHNTSISNLRFEGADSARYAKAGSVGKNYSEEGYADLEGVGAGFETGKGGWCKAGGNGFQDLQGGAGFETPGCSDPYACSLTPCINGKFTTPACYKWASSSDIAVKNVLVENVVATQTNNGFFGAPLNEHLKVSLEDFNISKHRPSNIVVRNFECNYSLADGINLHGSFDDVLVDGYVVHNAEDDCIALWSYKGHLGAVTINNSVAGSCGYMACYAVYGGSGGLVYSNNTCGAKGPGNHNCLWLQDQFDGQFASASPRVQGEGFQCNSWECDGSARTRLCPAKGIPLGHCENAGTYEADICRKGNQIVGLDAPVGSIASLANPQLV